MARPKSNLTEEEKIVRLRQQKREWYRRKMQQEGAREEWRLKTAASVRRWRTKAKACQQ